MTVLLLRKTAFLIFFCNIVITQQDFLEHYKPRPGLPKPLNEWLAYVQEHKRDFKFINNIVKRRKEEQDYYDETEKNNQHKLLESNDDEYIDEVPPNDIYPHHIREEEQNMYKNSGGTPSKQKHQKKQSKKQNKSNINRMRRESSKNSFFEHINNLQIESNGKVGEIKRMGEKYPGQFRNKDQQGKREIQIDVLNDGKLVKSIKGTNSDSKSILLNIDTSQDNQLTENRVPIKKSNVYVYSPEKSSLDEPQQDEKAINYNNLYTVNKDLNTDISVPKNILMYHVTLGNTDVPIQETASAANFDNFSDYNFHENNFKDMSKYWSDSEKQQLQKGIQFAHDTFDLKNMVQSIPNTNTKLTDGFEPVKSIVVDHSYDRNLPNKMQLPNLPYSKRHLETLEGAAQFHDAPIDVISRNNEQAKLTTVKIVISQQQNPPDEHMNAGGEIEVETDEAGDHSLDVTPASEEMNQELFHHHNKELPNSGGENINNHIDITIIQPQDEKKNHSTVDKFWNRPEHANMKIEDQKEMHEKTSRERGANMKQEDRNEKELEEEKAEEEDINKEGDNPREEELEDEIIREEEIKVEKDHKHSELGEDNKTVDERDKSRIVEGNCGEGEENIMKERLIGRQIHEQKKVNKGPSVRVKVDISKARKDIDKKSNFSKRNIPNKHQHKRPIHCGGKNCNSKIKNKKKSSSYNFRQLKSVNYIYDADIEAPHDEDYAEEEMSSVPSRLSDINKKDAVEGDYGDEEDSFTLEKNETNKIVKLTNNEFANPRTVSSREDDDDGEYYDEEAPTSKKKNLTSNANHEHTAKFREHTAEFGKHMHNKKHKLPPKTKKESSERKAEFQDKENYVREPRSQVSFEDFQQLPKFVMNDRINEEDLRKRSLTSKKEISANKFPLSSNGFFTRDSKQNEFKRSGENISDKATANPVSDKASANDTVVVTVAGNNAISNKSSTLVNIHEILGITKTSVTPSSATECGEGTISVGNVCGTESFNVSDIEITTLLSIIPEVELQMINNNSDILGSKEKFEKFDEALSGELPISLVNTIYDHLKTDETFKKRIYKGMKRRYEKFPITPDDIRVVSQEQNRKMLNIMETIINKLEWNTNCQKIPNRIKKYLKSITKAETFDALTKTKEMEEVEFDDTQNARNFLFNQEGQGLSSNALAQKAQVLKDMLDKFEQLPADCQARAEPVKKFVEEHLLMLDHVNDLIHSQKENTETVTGMNEVTVNGHQKPIRRNDQVTENDLVEEQLESLGLGKNHNFKPKFNLDALVEKSRSNIKRQQPEGKIFKSEKKSKRELTNEGSKQYQKLLGALKRERIKRERKRRLAETFGKLDVDDYNGENVIKEIFESPIVYTM